MKYRIGICDDEPMIIEVNKKYVKDISDKIGIEIEISCFNNGRDLVLFMEQKNNLDIIFLDIDMKEITGISVALQLQLIRKDVIIIFVTGHREFALDAFDVDATGYIVKPIDPKKIEKLMIKAVNLNILSQNKIANTSLTIIEENNKKKIPQYKILYIEKQKNKCAIYTRKSTYYCYNTIGKILEKLENYFWQINQGVIVNNQFIKEIVKNDMILKNGITFTMGRKYTKEIKEKFFNENNNIQEE